MYLHLTDEELFQSHAQNNKKTTALSTCLVKIPSRVLEYFVLLPREICCFPNFALALRICIKYKAIYRTVDAHVIICSQIPESALLFSPPPQLKFHLKLHCYLLSFSHLFCLQIQGCILLKCLQSELFNSSIMHGSTVFPQNRAVILQEEMIERGGEKKQMSCLLNPERDFVGHNVECVCENTISGNHTKA